MELSQASKDKLSTVHQDLGKVILEVSKSIPLMVVCGHRDELAQNEAYSSGASKLPWPNSKHNSKPSLAIDISPIPYEIKNVKKLIYVAGFVMGTADRMGVTLRWGGDFNQNLNPSDDTFQDLYHFELVQK